MKVVVFAGGVGTRLWPLSRKNTPKQFEKIIGNASTLQQAVDRVLSIFPSNDVFVATGKRYEKIVREQLPSIPAPNFIFEPEMRDVGPAIGLVTSILVKKFPDEPMAILWSDHIVKNLAAFTHAIRIAEDSIKQKGKDFVFIAQKARFANQNMGWIEVGSKIREEGDVIVYNFKKLFYQPKLSDAKVFFSRGNYVWNLGYFVTTPRFLSFLFSQHVPDMYAQLEEITHEYGTHNFEKMLDKIYPSLEKISFDDAILVKMDHDKALVISTDLGWSDVGAWESLKEALAKNPEENATKGNVLLEDTKDSLVFNYSTSLIVGIDLDQMLVVNTGDVLLVCPKASVPKIKKMVESLTGTPHEHLA